jgi:hypothetical protein
VYDREYCALAIVVLWSGDDWLRFCFQWLNIGYDFFRRRGSCGG